MMEENLELEHFLRRVDELDNVLRESAITVPQEGAVSSDGSETKCPAVDRTVINPAGFKDDDPPIKGNHGNNSSASSVSQDMFLRSIEADANQRAAKRKKQRDAAMSLKARGNDRFQGKDYHAALRFYTEALGLSKDYVILYTNRAQTYIKLNRFPEAIEDCRTAILLEPANIKARVHLGKANVALKDFTAAINAYREIVDIDIKQEEMVKEYIAEAQLAQSSALSAEKAEELFNRGDTMATGVVELVKRLKEPCEPIECHDDHMQMICLTALLTDAPSRALFRKYDGFSLVKRFPKETGKDSRKCRLACLTFKLMTAALTDNEENVGLFAGLRGVAPLLVIGALSSPSRDLLLSCLQLLLVMSQWEVGISGIAKKLDASGILGHLLTIKLKEDSSTTDQIIDNLMASDKFCDGLVGGVDQDVFPAIEEIMCGYCSLDASVVALCVRVLDRIVRRPKLKLKLLQRPVLIAALLPAMEKYSVELSEPTKRRVVDGLLLVMINVYQRGYSLADGKERPLSGRLLSLALALLHRADCTDLQTKVVGLMSCLLPGNSEGINVVAKQRIIPKILSIMKGSNSDACTAFGIKCLATMTQSSEAARLGMVEADRDLASVRSYLGTDSNILTANTALIIGHCASVAGLSSRLVQTDIVKTLLSLTDTACSQVRENCAIALAKLATTNHSHLDELRQLGGIGILNSCMKTIKTA